MSRKIASNKNKADSEVEVMEENLQTGVEPEKAQETQDQDNQEAIECEGTATLLSGKAKKLSPKSESYIYFDLVKATEDEELYLKLTGNDSGGLFTKELIPIRKLINILKEYKDKSFKSTVLKPAIIGGSANNPSFTASALRSDTIGLIKAAPNSLFLHVLSTNFDERCDELIALVSTKSTTKATA
ncbi:hypothetical protein J4H46_04030 [Vibrio alginolyticus]|uniref:hypothetical protein n=1 Tax=Vibrio TaxID=662 RepID=UPI001967D6B4|nr:MULTISPECIES: hypothetical protein [Vibrio]EIV8672278.1 hypothetical protein [Vibrio parahaemolyticus]EHA1205338.1 hypothetical protein [Vibrio alginolyticus]EJL6722247.1 hypothetical protein [Vibrio alginolyticus]ELA6769949.1 hypothetical protein [Vibrio alginolyticus]MBN2998791.1 hypothetical protein [Vibrio alginolyticus]